MILEVRVGGHKDSEAFLLSGVEQLAVLELGPATFVGSYDLMPCQHPPQRNGSALVKEHAHLGRGQGATRRMLQYGANLLDGDTRKPFDELRYECAVLEVLEEGRD